jgi:hypothetical protein
MGEHSPPAAHYTKRTLAAVQCFTVRSQRKETSSEHQTDSVWYCKCFHVCNRNRKLLILLDLGVGSSYGTSSDGK